MPRQVLAQTAFAVLWALFDQSDHVILFPHTRDVNPLLPLNNDNCICFLDSSPGCAVVQTEELAIR